MALAANRMTGALTGRSLLVSLNAIHDLTRVDLLASSPTREVVWPPSLSNPNGALLVDRDGSLQSSRRSDVSLHLARHPSAVPLATRPQPLLTPADFGRALQQIGKRRHRSRSTTLTRSGWSAASAQIAHDCHLLGHTYVCADAIIGPRSRLTRCVVLPGAIVPAGTVAQDLVFGSQQTYDLKEEIALPDQEPQLKLAS